MVLLKVGWIEILVFELKKRICVDARPIEAAPLIPFKFSAADAHGLHGGGLMDSLESV